MALLISGDHRQDPSGWFGVEGEVDKGIAGQALRTPQDDDQIDIPWMDQRSALD